VVESSQADTHTHFDDMLSTLNSSGHLHFSSSMREGSGDGYLVEDYVRNSSNHLAQETVYDSSMEATKFYTNSGWLEDIMFEFSSIISGDVWIQVETRFDEDWAQEGDNVGGGKFWRPRKNDIGNDDRLFDFQVYGFSVCNNNPNCPAAIPRVRCYDCSPDGGEDDPLSHPDDSENWQPGGDTAGGRRLVDRYTIDDHVSDSNSPFLYIPGRWIRETYHLDIDAGRLKVWMSDEETDTTLLIADVDDSSLGFNLHPTSTYGINAINFNVNLSSDTLGETKITHWHRNLIVGHNLTEQEEQDLLDGRPGTSSDTTPPSAPSGLGVE
jgi:hypothetical protein